MMLSTEALLTILLVAVVALVAYAVGHSIGTLRTLRQFARAKLSAASAETLAPEAETRRHFALVYNPTKPDAASVVAEAQAAARNAGWATPLVFASDEDDGGVRAARQAVQAGVELVIAAGGDGTVRAVAHVLAGTEVALGLVPLGTGNLLARNTGLFMENREWSFDVAMHGVERGIDVIRTRTAPDDDPDTSVVMTGMGYDAAVMESVSPELKQRIGWLAYVEAGSRELQGKRTKVRMKLDDAPVRTFRVRSVLGANAGRVQGGLELLPGARPDDGLIDVLVTTPKNIAQWAGVVLSVVGRRRRGLATEVMRCSSLTIEAEEPLALQLDGDFAGMSDYLEMKIDKRALRLRVPSPDERRRIRAAQWRLAG